MLGESSPPAKLVWIEFCAIYSPQLKLSQPWYHMPPAKP
jgi:hypothetical protein